MTQIAQIEERVPLLQISRKQEKSRFARFALNFFAGPRPAAPAADFIADFTADLIADFTADPAIDLRLI